MKLDLNNSGAWKTVIDFPDSNLAVVRAAARSLIKASNDNRLKFRIRSDEGLNHSYLEKPECEWRAAQ